MAEVTATMIKDLRERTGSGMADCKKALVETGADIEKAIDYLREKGLAKAAKKAGRIATEGVVCSYIHGTGRVGVLLEVNCETDFVARNEDFQQFTRDVAMQIAAMNPQFVRREEVSETEIEKERAIRMAEAKNSGKPEKVIEKIVDGQINKWLADICLLEQMFVKDDKKSINDLTQALVAKLGENIQVRRFARYELGEGLEKKETDFAKEVAEQAGMA
jgi:elongation factor Ts